MIIAPAGRPPRSHGSEREVVLEVDRLRKTYRARRRGQVETVANADLSLEVHAGEVVALLGPNGAGKSTFLRQVAGQLLPSSGGIRVAGIDLVADPRAAKELLSAIPQECQPIGTLTVEEEVRGFGLIKGLPRDQAAAEVDRILRAVGLDAERTKLVRELSGGFKRRLLIAIAMAGARPRLMLLDEPTTGLDPESRRDVWKVVHDLRAAGLGILLTTHYIEEAEYLADRVVIIHGGRFVAEGTVAELRTRLPFRGRVDIRELDRLSAEGARGVAECARTWRTAFRSEAYLRFEVPDPFAPETIAALARLTSLGVPATLSSASLEDAYLAVVGRLGEAQ